MHSTESGISTVTRLVHPWKLCESRIVTESGISIRASLLQLENVPSAMVAIEEERCTDASVKQSRKAEMPMITTESGITTDFRLRHSTNAWSPTDVNDPGNVTDSSLMHWKKARPWSLVTKGGIVTEVMRRHPRNAAIPTVVTRSGITIAVSAQHSRNAELPIAATVDGRATDTSRRQPPNAELPIEVTPSGITTEVSFSHPRNALDPTVASSGSPGTNDWISRTNADSYIPSATTRRRRTRHATRLSSCHRTVVSTRDVWEKHLASYERVPRWIQISMGLSTGIPAMAIAFAISDARRTRQHGTTTMRSRGGGTPTELGPSLLVPNVAGLATNMAVVGTAANAEALATRLGIIASITTQANRGRGESSVQLYSYCGARRGRRAPLGSGPTP
eukprot:m.182063 g.182063  ORF g.182063 m.182063 type:complete len:392 (-) comp24619_c0_seq2:108-1283(-)